MKPSLRMEPEALWERVLAVIQGQVNGQSFQTWFRPTKLVRIEDNVLFVEGPNQFFTDWLSEHHLPVLLAASQEVMGAKPRIELVIRGDEEAALGKRGQGRSRVSFFKRYTHTQKPGGLMLNANYTFAEFVVGDSNQLAHAASLAISEKPGKVYNPLFIYGGVGLGKTHLAQAIAHFVLEEHKKAKVFYTSSESFMNELIFSIRKGKTLEFKNKYRNTDLLIIDDIQFLAGKETTQEEFFHTFNALYDANKQIVLTSDRSPKEIKSIEERLTSRFEWGLITDIQTPGLETRLAILRKKIEKDGLLIPDDVLFVIAENVRNNIRELEGSLIRLLAFAGLTHSEITPSLAREVLRDFIQERTHTCKIQDIQKAVAEKYSISLDLMKSEKRSRRIVLPRQVAAYLCRDLTDKSLADIGRNFGGRDHSTVLHACRKIEKLLKEDDELRLIVTELQQSFRLRSH